MVIDSHQHFWIYHPKHQEWITDDMSLIQNDFLPTDLESLLSTNGVDGCIAVQADQSYEETDFLIHLADQHSFIKGVVGWVDLCSEDIDETLKEYAKNYHFKGVRHVLQAEQDSFFSNEKFKNGIGRLAKYGLTYDILIYHHQLNQAIELVSQFPNQKFVLDHIGKPNINKSEIETWSENIGTLSKFPNVYVKVSGLVTEADWKNWEYHEMVPYLDIIFEAFGVNRIMFGSDWPVCLLASDYSTVKGIVQDYIERFDVEQQKMIMGSTALDFYGITNKI
ncbi:amidohydrolase family protein [Maribacter sp. X9]|uniref:amidohydrolase family protein n=1 Tax=Maribacter sp. X9 TaxID=3402159 RepID=UPI003AF3EDFB